MHFSTIRVERPEGTPLLKGVAVQIELAPSRAALTMGADLAGARPFDLFWVYTTQGVPRPPIERRDVLYDELRADPETGQPAKYRVVATVATYLDDHQEALCERVIGR